MCSLSDCNMTYRSLFRMFSSDLAITWERPTRSCTWPGGESLLDEPSIVAVHRQTGENRGVWHRRRRDVGPHTVNEVAHPATQTMA